MLHTHFLILPSHGDIGNRCRKVKNEDSVCLYAITGSKVKIDYKPKKQDTSRQEGKDPFGNNLKNSHARTNP